MVISLTNFSVMSDRYYRFLSVLMPDKTSSNLGFMLFFSCFYITLRFFKKLQV